MNFKEKIIPQSGGGLSLSLRKLPRPIVFTNGVFDILHPGHVDYLEKARLLGAALVVGINTDTSVRGLKKGEDRPINSELDRAVMLAALEAVALVTFFNEKTPLRLLGEVRPDFYVKGGDYNIDDLEESVFVRSYGGEAQAIQFSPGYSTTALLSRIRNFK